MELCSLHQLMRFNIQASSPELTSTCPHYSCTLPAHDHCDRIAKCRESKTQKRKNSNENSQAFSLAELPPLFGNVHGIAETLC